MTASYDQGARPANKWKNCEVCGQRARPMSYGMYHNCYNVWARSGRPDRRLVAKRRRKWLRENSTLTCVVCGRVTTRTYQGMDMACHRAWVAAGRPDLEQWALERRAGPVPRQCVVCNRPTEQVYFGIDQRCYKVWCRAVRPDLDEWVPVRHKWLGYRGQGLVRVRSGL
jgi:hypothetical protein